VQRVFAIYDKTGSGMNVGQLHTALLAVGRDISATDCADLLDEADTDGDGLLSKVSSTVATILFMLKHHAHTHTHAHARTRTHAHTHYLFTLCSCAYVHVGWT